MSVVGILGGTFDPPHFGHLATAEEVRFRLGLDEMLFIPAGSPPHKAQVPVTAVEHRLRMLQLAVADNPAFKIDLVEIERSGPSYTVDTLEELRKKVPNGDLVFVLGSDEFALLSTWHQPQLLPRLARLAVMVRSGVLIDTAKVEEEVPGLNGRYELVPVPNLAISSSALRARVRAGLPIRYLLPDAVREYIERSGLYQD